MMDLLISANKLAFIEKINKEVKKGKSNICKKYWQIKEEELRRITGLE